MPLISVGFDQEVVNNGILPLVFRGDGNVSYTEGLDGMALDLSQSSMYRKPIILINEHRTKITDYSGISILLWTQMGQDDFNNYVILGQKDEFEDFEPFGWSISSGISGAWSWWISDGVNEQNYRPLPSRQAIN
ncbi:MAG TPA: exotoxin, partial [Marinilabiliaceae bacterium]|nr:exotoxin [Marinilabiliaceae bacterium]